MKTLIHKYGLQGLKYAASGGTGFGVALALTYLLTEYVKMKPVVSVGVAYFANISIKFILHKFWAFESKKSGTMYGETWRYAAARGIFWTLTTSIFWGLQTHTSLHYMTVSVLVTGILAVPNFLVTRWIFVRQKT